MSYFPDYRKQTDKMNEVDQSFVRGFRLATDMLLDALEHVDDEDLLSIEKEIIAKLSVSLKDYIDTEEIMLICALFDKDEYDNVELEDEHPMFNINRDN